MIVIDTSFLSSFIKIGKLDLIFRALKTDRLIIPEGVLREINQPNLFIALIPYLDSNQIMVKSIKTMPEAHGQLGDGELECVALAEENKTALLMDDRKACQFAEDRNITVIDIPSFLFHCKEKKILTVEEIEEIISNLKEKDYYEFEEEIKRELLK